MSIVVKIGGEVIGSGEAKVLAADLRILVDEGALVAVHPVSEDYFGRETISIILPSSSSGISALARA